MFTADGWPLYLFGAHLDVGCASAAGTAGFGQQIDARLYLEGHTARSNEMMSVIILLCKVPC